MIIVPCWNARTRADSDNLANSPDQFWGKIKVSELFTKLREAPFAINRDQVHGF
jgi:hypothetical protein